MTDTTEQSELLPGIYHIVVAFGPGDIHGRRLTDEKGHVTISPPSAHPDPRQEWLVRPVHGIRDIVVIERPFFAEPLGNHLSYEGAPEKPKKHEKIILNRVSTEWVRAIGPGRSTILRVNGSDLGIALGLVEPLPNPTLCLDDKDELNWFFERVAHPVK